MSDETVIPVEQNVAVPEEDPQQINWKKFRETREIERKQREEAEKRASEKEAEAQALKAAMESLLSKPAVSQDDPEDEDSRIQKKIDAIMSKREVQMQEQLQRREQQEFPAKLKSAYSDFDHICTTENLDYLEYHYPEVAAGFKHMPDGFDKWANIYKAVKRFIPNADAVKDKGRIEKNASKPQSMSVSGVTQTGDNAPIQLDDKRRADNWQRMQRVMKGGR